MKNKFWKILIICLAAVGGGMLYRPAVDFIRLIYLSHKFAVIDDPYLEAEGNVNNLRREVKRFYCECGHVPNEGVGLPALFEATGECKNPKRVVGKPEFKETLIDPWGHEIFYRVRGNLVEIGSHGDVGGKEIVEKFEVDPSLCK